MSGKEREALPDHHLILGDCLGPLGLSTLPDKSVGVVCTDPPYSEHVHTRSRRGHIGLEVATGRASFSRSTDFGFAHLTTETREAAAAAFARIAQRWVLVFCDVESAHLWRGSLEYAGLEFVRTAFWHKEDGTPQFTGDRPGIACEAIVVAHRPGRKRWNGGGKPGFYSHAVVQNRGGNSPRFHTAQKPIDLMEALVSDFTDPGELVCDPFAGSGTTLVACKRLGRRAIGWERDAAFWERAVRRLENTKQQYELIPRGPKPKQLKLGGA